jgi:hypothetical protein
MEIKMLKTIPGSIDGIVTQLFKKGQKYDTNLMGSKLTGIFLKEGYAEEVPPADSFAEEKMVQSVPENKAFPPEVSVDVAEDVDDIVSKGFGKDKKKSVRGK